MLKMDYKALENCKLCPRGCGVNRLAGQRGRCKMGADLAVARAALHYWEETCISGTEGSGAVFFSGCNMGCIFCQNYQISDGSSGNVITIERLSDIFLDLQRQGANNINLVTPTHYVPQIIDALDIAKDKGMNLPVVYNTSGYECAETLRMLDGYVDIYLPDYKYRDAGLAKEYSHAEDYPEVADAAIEEMVRQIGKCRFDKETGLMKRGVIVRHMVLPGHVQNSRDVLEHLFLKYGNHIYYSIMSQYTPMPHMSEHKLLHRRVTKREYDRAVDFAVDLGIENGFIQEMEVAVDSFIPAFDGSGVREL